MLLSIYDQMVYQTNFYDTQLPKWQSADCLRQKLRQRSDINSAEGDSTTLCYLLLSQLSERCRFESMSKELCR